MTPTFLVVDDFLSNVYQIRDAALKLNYPKHTHPQLFPGRNASQKLNIQGLDSIICQLVGEKVIQATESTSGHCRVALENEIGKHNVHVDPHQWSALLYLTLPEHCHGGTDFYKHIPTNMDRVPLNDMELNQLNFTSYYDVQNKIILPHTNQKKQWELTTHIPMRFNRLVIFRSWLYHNAGPAFGTNITNGRLIYPLFYSKA